MKTAMATNARHQYRERDARCFKIVMALENNPYPQDVRVRNEAEELAAAGHDVLVLAPRAMNQPPEETVRGVRVKRFRLPSADGVVGIAVEYAAAFLQLTRHLIVELARGADVIHLHNPPDVFFPVAGLARVSGRAVVFDHHDLAPELFEQRFGKRWPASVLRWCERMTMRVANVVVAANESHRLIAITRGQINQQQVVVVRNAPQRRTLAHGPFVRRGMLRNPRLCYVGALGPQDGVALLPEVIRRLCSCDLEPKLTVVGDGSERSTIARLAEELEVLDHIEFTGRIDQERVPPIVEEADICLDVAPATPLNHRSTMIKIGEYLAAGKPIVTFDLHETRVTAGECALYAPNDDVREFCRLIVSLCGDEEARATLSRRALEHARAETWEQSAVGLGHAYRLVEEALDAV